MPTPSSSGVEGGLGRPAPFHDEEEGYDGMDENQALLTTSERGQASESTQQGAKHDSSNSGAEDGVVSPTKPDAYHVGTKKMSGASYWAQLIGAFAVGVLCTVIMQLIIVHCSTPKPSSGNDSVNNVDAQAVPPYVGSSEVHHFPPTKPTNKFPELFPSDVGYAGATPTGAEPAIVATAPAWPMHTGAPQLVVPTELDKSHHGHHHHTSEMETEEDSDDDDDDDDDEDEDEKELKHGKGKKRKFNMLEKWGNLSPWYSIERGGFGLDSGVEAPDTCRVTGLHFLHRHGARYPTEWARYGGPARLAKKFHENTQHWTGSGKLTFLNDWTYKLGAELLTPFGRQQLFDLGVTMRIKYGFLLENFTETNTIPVFRTESQDRMLASARNFALGFFGWPYDGQYQQSITIEQKGFNNTLAPYKTCPNANINEKGDRGVWYNQRWAEIYLQDAHKRLTKEIKGFDLTVEDVFTMQQMCAYETVALGYSKFCELFTEEEWEGFDYALDLFFWYGNGFGSPVARVLGIGWIQELVARLTHTPIAVHNSSTNATLDDNPITFPLDQSLYVDATHEVVVLNIITALNLTTFAEQGPLPYTHIPENRKFRVSELAPFATNMHFQLLECTSHPEPQIRIIINDGVVPLTGIKGCPEQEDGMCPVATFVEGMREMIKSTDWIWDCHGDWEVPPGDQWNTTTGEPPKRV
ncbi:hypothetical protein D9756_008974 [Leucocoprinus leucothites]|uniref:Phosphoglycerate mutase-like protein n=1 Tax=Leucocoprinus leucothites TaxID=201217 RepID=A0A8H5CXB6_9AGAR|nr:hypothetical protein D9756_008974 [Leucoagaricus leucothites]